MRRELSGSGIPTRRILMAKGQQRGNREAKKPKQQKPKTAAGSSTLVSIQPKLTSFPSPKRK